LGQCLGLGFKAAVQAAQEKLSVSDQLKVDLKPWGIGREYRDHFKDEEIIESDVDLEFRLFGRQLEC
jgi:hypothetical protein